MWPPRKVTTGLTSPLAASAPAAEGAMADEYGQMDNNDRVFHLGSFTLESGLVLPDVRVA